MQLGGMLSVERNGTDGNVLRHLRALRLSGHDQGVLLVEVAL